MRELIISIITVILMGLVATNFASFKSWLVWAVTEAETYFGSGTGQLKLKYAYNLAIGKYPIIAKLMPYKLFNYFVKKALKVMDDMIVENKSIEDAIYGTVDEIAEKVEV